MAKLYDNELELRALFTILNGNERVRQALLSRVNPEYFGHPLSREILETTYKIIRIRKKRLGEDGTALNALPIPSSKALQGAPGISDDAKIILSKPREAIESRADVDEIVRNLEFYRKIRVIQREAKGIVQNMRGSVDRINMDTVRNHLIRAVEGIQDYDAARSVTILKGKEGRDLAKRALRATTLTPTGFKNYDEKGGGLEIGDLFIAAAPTGGGKSVMLLTLAIHLYLFENMSVCIPTFELSKELYQRRLLAAVCGVKFEDIRRSSLSKQDRKLVMKLYDDFMAHGKKKNCQFAIMEPGNASVEELGMTLKPYGFQVIVPDHLNHVRHTEGDADHSQLGFSARMMKRQAEDNKQIWLTATQLDDESQKIRYSKMIKEEADTGWAWVVEDGSDVVKVKPLKTRHHEPFDFYLQKDFQHMAFLDSAGPPLLSDGEDGDEFVKSMDSLPE